jgi:hypothetical protein
MPTLLAEDPPPAPVQCKQVNGVQRLPVSRWQRPGLQYPGLLACVCAVGTGLLGPTVKKKTMKPVAATAITIAALLSACGGNTTHAADPTAPYLADVKANLKAHGFQLPPGMSEDTFDKGLLGAGHMMCNWLAQGKSPDEILTLAHPDPGAKEATARNIAAAEAYLCPQYKGKQ